MAGVISARADDEALTIVRGFAAAHGWARHAEAPFHDAFEVFDDQAALWRRILEVHSMSPDTPLACDGLTAALERRVLMALTPAAYARVRPEYAAAPGAWVRLLAHEMAHRLHVRILDGDEEAMGPRWFYEGFAVVASGQDLCGERCATTAEALAAAATEGRGAYARWGAALSHLRGRAPLPELVARAGQPGFEGWLSGL